MTLGIERPTLPLSSAQITILMKPSCGDYLMATLSVEVDIGCKHHCYQGACLLTGAVFAMLNNKIPVLVLSIEEVHSLCRGFGSRFCSQGVTKINCQEEQNLFKYISGTGFI